MIILFVVAIVILRLFYSAAEMYFERDWPHSTWRGLAVALGLLVMCCSAFGQTAVRVDYSLQTLGPLVPTQPGPLPQTLWVANSSVAICAHVQPYTNQSLANCQANPITTYVDSAETATCSSTTQLVQLPGNTCTSTTGAASNLGFWYAGGAFDYYVISAYGTFGPYTGPASGGGGGAGGCTPGAAGYAQFSNGTGCLSEYVFDNNDSPAALNVDPALGQYQAATPLQTLNLFANSAYGGTVNVDPRPTGEPTGEVNVYGGDEDYGYNAIEEGGTNLYAHNWRFCDYDSSLQTSLSPCPSFPGTALSVYGTVNALGGEFYTDTGIHNDGGFRQDTPIELNAAGSPYTLNYDGYFQPIDASDGDVVINLDNLTSSFLGANGLQYDFVKEDATGNTVTINAYSGQTINGASSVVLTSQYQAAQLTGNYSYDLGGTSFWSASNGGGGGNLPANAFGALNNNGSGTLAWIPPFAVDVTQAPYSAKCDGSTDDSAAIQACLDNNGACFIPTGPSPPVQCEIPSGISLCSTNNHFMFNALFGNGQILDYKTGTGSAITVNNCAGPVVIDGLVISMSAASGSPTSLTVENAPSEVSNVTIKDTSDVAPSLAVDSYTSVDLNNATLVLFYSGDWQGGLNIQGSTEIEIEDSYFASLTVDSSTSVDIQSSGFANDINANTVATSPSVAFQGDQFTNGFSVTGSANVSFSGSQLVNGGLTATGVQNSVNGDLQFYNNGTPAVPSVTGAFNGLLLATDAHQKPYYFQNGTLQNGRYYSAAGTALPTCNSGLISGGFGVGLWVSDATSLSGAYASGGDYTAPVYCGYNSGTTTYTWEMTSAASGTYTASSPIVVTGTVISCPTCSVGTGTSVAVNGGSALGSLNINATTPTADSSFLALTPKISGSNMITEAPYGTGSAFGVFKAGTGLTATAGVIAPNFGTATNDVAEGGVVTAGGPTGGATAIPVVTYNAAGQITALTTATPTVATVQGGATNQPLYQTAANTTGFITAVNNAVMSTNGSGVPSESATLPSGLSATNMTLITPALGTPSSGVITSLTGTCATCIAHSAASATTATNLAGTTVSSIPYQSSSATTGYISPVFNALVITNGSGVPLESTTLPSGLTIPGYAAATASLTINNTSCALGSTCYPPINAFTPITLSTVNLGATPYDNYVTGVIYNAQSTTAAAFAVTLPAPTVGAYWCVKNYYNGSAFNTGIITVTVANTGTQSIIYAQGSVKGTAISSAGAAGDYGCFTGVSTTQWDFNPSVGTW